VESDTDELIRTGNIVDEEEGLEVGQGEHITNE
jgi:hypothetical protein